MILIDYGYTRRYTHLLKAEMGTRVLRLRFESRSNFTWTRMQESDGSLQSAQLEIELKFA